MKTSVQLPPTAEPKKGVTAATPASLRSAFSEPWEEGHGERMCELLAERVGKPVQAKAEIKTGYESLIEAARRSRPQQIQARLSVGAVDDRFEEEAEAVAEEVMRNPAPSVQHRRRMDGEGQDRPTLQSKTQSSVPTLESTPQVESVVNSANPGSPLAESVRRRVEPVLGIDLAHVRVHSSGAVEQAAAEIRADAFTHQHHIFLGHGRRADDLSLMAHEATHVAQQQAGVMPQLLQRLPHVFKVGECNLRPTPCSTGIKPSPTVSAM
jgi:Domain of unknown function (DUF4157)